MHRGMNASCNYYDVQYSILSGYCIVQYLYAIIDEGFSYYDLYACIFLFHKKYKLRRNSSHGNVKRMKYITVYDKYWHSVALAEKVKMILELA